MIDIDLGNFSKDDLKHIKELKEMGVSEDVIQLAYENTKNKRKEIKNDSNQG